MVKPEIEEILRQNTHGRGVKYSEISFWTDESNFDKVRRMLTQNGLVIPRNDPFGRTADDILVWEDVFLVGMYRVHFKPDHPKGSQIYFRYWTGRLTLEIEEKDPMSEVVRKTREILWPIKKIRTASQGILMPSEKSDLISYNTGTGALEERM